MKIQKPLLHLFMSVFAILAAANLVVVTHYEFTANAITAEEVIEKAKSVGSDLADSAKDAWDNVKDGAKEIVDNIDFSGGNVTYYDDSDGNSYSFALINSLIDSIEVEYGANIKELEATVAAQEAEIAELRSEIATLKRTIIAWIPVFVLLAVILYLVIRGAFVERKEEHDKLAETLQPMIDDYNKLRSKIAFSEDPDIPEAVLNELKLVNTPDEYYKSLSEGQSANVRKRPLPQGVETFNTQHGIRKTEPTKPYSLEKSAYDGEQNDADEIYPNGHPKNGFEIFDRLQ